MTMIPGTTSVLNHAVVISATALEPYRRIPVPYVDKPVADCTANQLSDRMK